MPSALYALDHQGKLVHTEERHIVSTDGVTTICKAHVDEGQQPFALYELILAPHRRATLPNLTATQTATIYILDGTLAVRLGGQTITVGAGNVVQVGCAVACATWNPTSARVRCLVMIWPARNELSAIFGHEPDCRFN